MSLMSMMLFARAVPSARSATRAKRVVASAERLTPRLIGEDVAVCCLDGRMRRYINLDAAASTPALEPVADAVAAFMPWYSSVHRGTGFKSQVATAAFEGARDAIADYVGASDSDVVVFVRNTTEAINLVSFSLPEESVVVSTAIEHHANMLPWRRHNVNLLPFTTTPEELVEKARIALTSQPAPAKLLAVTGASNVTGEVPPLAALAAAAHEAGALMLVDAAQLAPHRPIDMRALGIDFLAISGHKMYAPYGAGALIGPLRQLGQSKPMIQGGGAIKFVTVSDVLWADAPERHEAGSPNTLGVVALGAACDTLQEIGMSRIVDAERGLVSRLRDGLGHIAGVRELRMWPDGSSDRVGVVTFVAADYPDHLLATVLSAEYGIGVRNGCFCAHPLVTHLLGVDAAEANRIRADVAAGDESRMPGAVRASLNVATTEGDIRDFLSAMQHVMVDGPAYQYRQIARRNEYLPVKDTRPWPDIPVRLAPHHTSREGRFSQREADETNGSS